MHIVCIFWSVQFFLSYLKSFMFPPNTWHVQDFCPRRQSAVPCSNTDETWQRDSVVSSLRSISFDCKTLLLGRQVGPTWIGFLAHNQHVPGAFSVWRLQSIIRLQYCSNLKNCSSSTQLCCPTRECPIDEHDRTDNLFEPVSYQDGRRTPCWCCRGACSASRQTPPETPPQQSPLQHHIRRQAPGNALF